MHPSGKIYTCLYINLAILIIKTYINIMKKNLYYYLAVLFLPNIFLFHLFSNNRSMNDDLFFIQFAVMAVFLSLISLCLFILYKKITGSIEGSFVSILASWLFFWLFEAFFSLAVKIFADLHKMALIAFFAVVIMTLLLLGRKYGKKWQLLDNLFTTAAVLMCLLFAYNFSAALYSDAFFTSQSPDEKPYVVKTEFIIDDTLENPDIYWFHMDEMMGFSAIQKYFGDAQNELKEELHKRGFIVNENATLAAGYSSVAIPSLLSPAFYDSYLEPHLKKNDHLLRTERQAFLNNQFASDNLNFRNDIVPNYEVLRAFKSIGYTTIAIDNKKWPAQIDYFYIYSNDKYPLMVRSENAVETKDAFSDFEGLIKLLTSATPLSLVEGRIIRWIHENVNKQWQAIPEYHDIIAQLTSSTLAIIEETRLYRRLHDSFSISSPKFVFIDNLIAHEPYNRIYQTNALTNPMPNNGYAAADLYLPQYHYTAKVMLITIDMVLNDNPNAIIVLQGDHGIHTPLAQANLLNEGFTESQIIEMNHSVISAIRIPPQFGGLDEPINPLNISRILVNNFVGENYISLDDY